MRQIPIEKSQAGIAQYVKNVLAVFQSQITRLRKTFKAQANTLQAKADGEKISEIKKKIAKL